MATGAALMATDMNEELMEMSMMVAADEDCTPQEPSAEEVGSVLGCVILPCAPTFDALPLKQLRCFCVNYV